MAATAAAATVNRFAWLYNCKLKEEEEENCGLKRDLKLDFIQKQNEEWRLKVVGVERYLKVWHVEGPTRGRLRW